MWLSWKSMHFQVKFNKVSSDSMPGTILSYTTGCHVLLTNISPPLFTISIASATSVLFVEFFAASYLNSLQSEPPFVQFYCMWSVLLNSGNRANVGKNRFLENPIRTKPIWFNSLIKGLGGGNGNFLIVLGSKGVSTAKHVTSRLNV